MVLTGNTSQTIQAGTNGTALGYTETPAATSRKWQYATTSGGPYTDFSPAQTGTSYTPNFATAGTYYVVVTSTFAGCGPISSNEAVITVTPAAATSITAPTFTPATICATAAASVDVTFTAAGTYNAGNVFTAQLSDGSGSFASPVATATLTSTTSGSAQTITLPIPAGTPSGTGYKVRVLASDPVTSSAASTASLTIVSNPAVTIAPSPSASTTQNTAVGFTGTETPAATSREWLYRASTDPAGTYPNTTGNTTLSYSFPATTAGTYYVVLRSVFPGCGAVLSAETQVTVAAQPLITLTANLTAFRTTAGSPSAAQSFTVEGSSLTNDLTVGPTTGYEFSTTSATAGFGPSLTLTPSSGAVPLTTVYVRLTGNTATGSLGLSIAAASTGATTRTITVGGTVVTEPTTAPSVTAGTPNQTTVTLNVSGGNGGKRLLVVRQAGTAAVAPTDKTTYTPNTTFGNSASNTTTGPGNYVVLASTSTSASVTGLTPGTSYVAEVYGYNDISGTPGFENYLTAPLGTVSFTTAAPALLVYTFASSASPSTTYPNVTGSDFTRNSVTDEGTANVFNSSNWPTATTVNLTKYIQFTITPAAGYQVNLQTLTFDQQRSTNGPTVLELRSSVDGFNTTIGSTRTVGTSTDNESFTLGAAFAAQTEPVTFRIYGYAAAVATGTFRVDNVTLVGTVQLAPAAPEIGVSQGATAINTNGAYDFGSANVGTPTDATFTITNTGTADLTISNVALSGAGAADYSITQQPATSVSSAAGSNTTTLTIRFTPSASGARNALLTITNNDANEGSYLINLTGVGVVPPATYYAKATGNLNDPTTFGLNADGTGTSPTSFTAPNQTYRVAGTGRTIAANWTVSGAGSKVVLEANASLVIPVGFTYTGTLDQLANSTLTIVNSTTAAYNNITQGVQDASSTIEFAQTGTYNLPSVGTFLYQNLKLTGGTKRFARSTTGSSPIITLVPGNLTVDAAVVAGNTSSPFSTVQLGGNLTLLNGASFDQASAGRFTLNLTGSSLQTLTGNGSDIILFRLNVLNSAGAALSNTGGSTNLEVGNNNNGGYLIQTGATLALNGNNLRFATNGKAVIYDLYSSSGDGLGTITPTATSSLNLETTSNSSIGTLRLTPGATTVQNLRLDAAQDVLEVPSDLTVNGTLTLVNGSLQVGDGTTPATLTLNGTVVSTIGNLVGSSATNLVVGGSGALGTLYFERDFETLNNLTLNRTDSGPDAGTATLGNVLTVNGALTLTAGRLVTTAANLLTLTSTASVAAGGAGYVDGPLARQVAPINAPTSPVTVTFPIGKTTSNRPLALNIGTQTSTTTYVAELKPGQPTDQTLTGDLARVSRIRSYSITPDAQPTGFSGTVTLSFDTDDQVTDPAASTLVIAKNNGSGWVNIGRTTNSGAANGGAYVAGTLTSDAFTSFSDFALASTDALNNTTNPLPVVLTAFSAQRQGEGALLQWTTAQEKNSAYFEVLRATDARRDFQVLGRVQSAGNATSAHHYSFRDAQLPAGTSYYRLRQVDQDGTSTLSDVRVVLNGTEATITLYPNPVRDVLHLVAAQPVKSWRVLSLTGKQLLTGNSLEAGLDVSRLAAGSYALELLTSDGTRRTLRFVKE